MTHIRNRVLATIPDAIQQKLMMRRLSYENALSRLIPESGRVLAPSAFASRGPGFSWFVTAEVAR